MRTALESLQNAREARRHWWPASKIAADNQISDSALYGLYRCELSIQRDSAPYLACVDTLVDYLTKLGYSTEVIRYTDRTGLLVKWGDEP